MGRYDFQSPGATATGAVQDFLKQRNAEQRQAMLDALQQQDMEHGWKVDEHSRVLADAANQRAGEMHTEELFGKKRDSLADGVDLSQVQDAELVEQIKKRGLANTKPASTTYGYGESGSDPRITKNPQQSTYAGSKDYQNQQRLRGYADDFINQASAAGDQEMMTAGNAVKNGMLNNLPAGLFEPAPSLQFIKPGGEKGNFYQGKRGQLFMEGNYAPSGGSMNHFQYGGTEPGTGRPLAFDTRNGGFAVAPIAGTNNPAIAAKPTAQSGPSAGLIQKLADAKGNVANHEARRNGILSGVMGPSAKTPQQLDAEQSYNVLLNGVIAAIPGSSPGLVDVAVDITSDPANNQKTMEQIVKENLDPTQYSPQELQTLQTIIGYLKTAQ